MAQTILSVAGLEANTDNAFRWELLQLAERLDLDVDLLAAVIAFESAGTWSPVVTNPNSGAVGLLQWTQIGATADGTTKAALRQMTAREQLVIVERRYAAARPRIKSANDYYLAVFAPARMPSNPTIICYSKADHPAAYEANKALDIQPPDGVITVYEATIPLYAVMGEAQKRPRIEVTKPIGWKRIGIATGGVIVAAIAAWLAKDNR